VARLRPDFFFGAYFGLKELMRNQRLQFHSLVCVFVCRRVKLPTFRAAVDSTDWEWLLAIAFASVLSYSSRSRLRALHPDFRSGSRIRTVLERITCAAMLRMQTLVCFPERCYKLRFRSQLPWVCIRCVRWHPPRALLW
jgi:hypothetical protein